MSVPTTEEIYGEMGGALRRFIRRRVSDEQTAEDLLQDVFVSVHDHLRELEDTEALGGWVYRIARNRIVDFYRRRATDDPGVPVPDEPDEAELRDQVAGWIRAAIDTLPDPYREAVALAELEGVPQAEIARRVGLSVSGAKSRVQRGRRMVRDRLTRCCHFEVDRLGRVFDATPRQDCCNEGAC